MHFSEVFGLSFANNAFMSAIKAVLSIAIVYSIFISEYISASSCVAVFTRTPVNALETKLKEAQIDLQHIQLDPVFSNQGPSRVNGILRLTGSFVINLKYKNKNVAAILLSQIHQNQNVYQSHINIKEAGFKNKGLGALLYLSANVLAYNWGLRVVSSISPSVEARKVHERFMALGMSKLEGEGSARGSRYQFDFTQIQQKEPALWEFVQKNVVEVALQNNSSK